MFDGFVLDLKSEVVEIRSRFDSLVELLLHKSHQVVGLRNISVCHCSLKLVSMTDVTKILDNRMHSCLRTGISHRYGPG